MCARITSHSIRSACRHSSYIPPSGAEPESRTFTEWLDATVDHPETLMSMITEAVECIPRSWPADKVNRWAHMVSSMSPKERVSFRVRARNSIGLSEWSQPSIQLKTTGMLAPYSALVFIQAFVPL